MINFRVYSDKNIDSRKAIKLYEKAFPKEERWPLDLLYEEIYDRYVTFDLIYDDDNFIGIAVFKENEDISYLVFFAIEGKLRRKGYGSEVLKKYIEEYNQIDKKFFVCLETLDESASNYKMRVRRHNFYTRNGLTYLPNLHVSEYGITYDVMANKEIEPEDYMNLFLVNHSKADLKRMKFRCWKSKR